MHASRLRLATLLAALAAIGVAAASSFVPLRHLAEVSAQERAKTAEAKAGGNDAASDEQAVRKAGAAYVEAMNKSDLEALVGFWSADADYIDESGKVTRGKEALAALLKKTLADLKGTKVTGKVQSFKLLRPEVAMVDGSLEFATPGGAKDSNRHAVVWVKSGDRWLISSARDLPAETDELPSLAYARLKSLEWLVGEWQDASDKIDVHVVCRWDRNKSFLLMDYDVKRPGEDPLQVTQRLGWDGHNGMVRSWVFDSRGGFGEGYWERNGNRWVVSAAGILPDGGTGSGTFTWEFVDADTFTWRSRDREVEGQPVADAEIKFVRKAAK